MNVVSGADMCSIGSCTTSLSELLHNTIHPAENTVRTSPTGRDTEGASLSFSGDSRRTRQSFHEQEKPPSRPDREQLDNP
ncbi:uncharacterized [Tachysurus ichikawai]